jgi:hypothetical protein
MDLNPESQTARVRITANLPRELAEQVELAKKPDESTSEAICRLVEQGLLVTAVLASTAQIKRQEILVERVGATVIKEVTEIKQKMRELVAQINKLI